MKTQDKGILPKKFERELMIGLLVIVVSLAMFVPLLASRTSSGGIRELGQRYEKGELADTDIFAVASFQYVDAERTNFLKEEARQNVLPHFSFSLYGTSLSMERITTFSGILNSGREGSDTELQSFLSGQNLQDSTNVIERLAYLDLGQKEIFSKALAETSGLILQKGLFNQGDVAWLVGQKKDRYILDTDVTKKPISEQKPQFFSETLNKALLQQFLAPYFDAYESHDKQFQPYLVLDALSLLLVENVIYDEARTVMLQEDAAKQVPDQVVFIAKGQKILTKDTVVTSEQLALLSRMGSSTFRYSIIELFGRILFILLSTSVAVFMFIQFLHKEKRLYLYLNLMLFSVALSLVAMLFLERLLQNGGTVHLDSFLPVFFAPIFVSHITSKKRLGLVAAFLLACYTTLMKESSSISFFFVLTISGICLYFFQYSIKRLEDIFNWFYACLISGFAALSLYLLNGLNALTLVPLLGGMILNISISIVLVEALVPLCERLFNIPTTFRLKELAFSESPLLERLSTVAQGTYNHSRYVSELAYHAARSIGANAMLARVGGIYHDIGKSDHPEYFVENQSTENKHDELKPSLSVAIIKSHVKLGVEKGREAGLPQEVLDIISQHHGNDVIQYFYASAKEEAQKAGMDVKVDDYMYNGSVPAFPEAAIVMLADCVEAASRTMKKPTPSKYQKLIKSIIMGKIERDQLIDSQLSLTDLDYIQEAFMQTLIGRDHHRIEYPDEIAESKNKGEGK